MDAGVVLIIIHQILLKMTGMDGDWLLLCRGEIIFVTEQTERLPGGQRSIQNASAKHLIVSNAG